MSDRFFLALMAAAAVVMIGFAAVWPQGLGSRSPWPFGHALLQQSAVTQAAMAREAAAAPLRRVAPGPDAPAGLRAGQ